MPTKATPRRLRPQARTFVECLRELSLAGGVKIFCAHDPVELEAMAGPRSAC